MDTSAFEHFFKPEVRSAGHDLIGDDCVFLKLSSDTQIDASVRATPPLKVAFRSVSIASLDFTVDCTCRSSKKGQLCKHIWAVLVLGLEKRPDFFDSKTNILKSDVFAEQAAAREAVRATSERQIAFETAQAEKHKAAVERQKQHAKAIRAEQKAKQKAERKSDQRSGFRAVRSPAKSDSKNSKSDRQLPPAVQTALAYFEVNGFSLKLPVDPAALGEAKRVLSRVFHPDKGGTQHEMLELLSNADVLAKHR